MRFLLTSAGISNPSIHAALEDLLGKPVTDASALFVPTAIYPFPGGAESARRAICGEAPLPLCELGWRSLGVLELTVLPTIKSESWVPALEQTDALLVWGGDVLYLDYWMRQSGVAALLPKLRQLTYVGVSAGSIVVTPYNYDAEFNRSTVPEGVDRGQAHAERALGLVDFTLVPHLDHEDFLPGHSAAAVEEWAASVPVPTYAIDDQTAVTVVDGLVDVVSEGQWRMFSPRPAPSQR